MTVAACRELALRRFGRRTKFNSVPTVVDGLRFDSKREAGRYLELAWLTKMHGWYDLRTQTRWPIVVNGSLVCHYVSDFDYVLPSGELVIEDVKSEPTKTPIYRLKKKLMLACYGVQITEIQ